MTNSKHTDQAAPKVQSEISDKELDAVSGGLKDIPDKDHFNQAAANLNDGSNTVGGSLTDGGNVVLSTGGTEGQGHGYKG